MSQEEYAEYPLVSNSSDESFSVLRFPEAARDDARVPPIFPPPWVLGSHDVAPPPLTDDEKLQLDKRSRIRNERFVDRHKQSSLTLENPETGDRLDGADVTAANTSRYIVVVPPSSASGAFTVCGVTRFLSFKNAKSFEAISLDRAEELMSSTKNLPRILAASEKQSIDFRRRDADEKLDPNGYLDVGGGSNVVGQTRDEVEKFTSYKTDLNEDDDARAQKVDEDEHGRDGYDGVDEEDDIMALAIDRRVGAKADEFAQVDHDFQDDDDDAAAFLADENMDGLEQGAEEMAATNDVDKADDLRKAIDGLAGESDGEEIGEDADEIRALAERAREARRSDEIERDSADVSDYTMGFGRVKRTEKDVTESSSIVSKKRKQQSADDEPSPATASTAVRAAKKAKTTTGAKKKEPVEDQITQDVRTVIRQATGNRVRAGDFVASLVALKRRRLGDPTVKKLSKEERGRLRAVTKKLLMLVNDEIEGNMFVMK